MITLSTKQQVHYSLLRRAIGKSGINSFYNHVRALGIFTTLKALFSSPSLGKRSLISIAHPGVKHPFHLRFLTSDLYAYQQVILGNEYHFETCREPRVMIDAGANIGLTSIYLANRYPNARIYALEPEDANFQLLCKNTAPYPNIVPLRKALWSEDTTVKVANPGASSWAFHVIPTEHDAPGGQNQLEGTTITSLQREHGIEKIDLLKIDIEGAEKEVFSAPTPWLANVESLIIELHEGNKPGCNRAYYNATNDFDFEWSAGESLFLTRHNSCMLPPKAALG